MAMQAAHDGIDIRGAAKRVTDRVEAGVDNNKDAAGGYFQLKGGARKRPRMSASFGVNKKDKFIGGNAQVGKHEVGFTAEKY